MMTEAGILGTGVHISIGGRIADFVGFTRLMEHAAHRKFWYALDNGIKWDYISIMCW